MKIEELLESLQYDKKAMYDLYLSNSIVRRFIEHEFILNDNRYCADFVHTWPLIREFFELLDNNGYIIDIIVYIDQQEYEHESVEVVRKYDG